MTVLHAIQGTIKAQLYHLKVQILYVIQNVNKVMFYPLIQTLNAKFVNKTAKIVQLATIYLNQLATNNVQRVLILIF